jgi:hypothetical protein
MHFHPFSACAELAVEFDGLYLGTVPIQCDVTPFWDIGKEELFRT